MTTPAAADPATSDASVESVELSMRVVVGELVAAPFDRLHVEVPAAWRRFTAGGAAHGAPLAEASFTTEAGYVEVVGALYDADAEAGLTAARVSSRLIAADLADLGITVDCLPLADVPVDGADAVIGNRAYGTNPDKVAAIARAVTEGLEQGGVLPVLKHIPGHGRATADTHFRLPVVDTSRAELERTDFAAFRPLADLPMAMTAHVVFSAIDPAQPATTSATMIEQVIRGVIGFQGLLMSDDVSMNALAGSITDRTKAIFAAGCDVVLHCNGKLDEMREVAAETPVLAGEALSRAEKALAARTAPQAGFDRQTARAQLDELVRRAGEMSA